MPIEIILAELMFWKICRNVSSAAAAKRKKIIKKAPVVKFRAIYWAVKFIGFATIDFSPEIYSEFFLLLYLARVLRSF